MRRILNVVDLPEELQEDVLRQFFRYLAIAQETQRARLKTIDWFSATITAKSILTMITTAHCGCVRWQKRRQVGADKAEHSRHPARNGRQPP